MYNIDNNRRFVPTPPVSERGAGALGPSSTQTPTRTARVYLCDLLGTGFALPHNDVKANMGDRSRCDTCGIKNPPHAMRVCDGQHPSNVGQTIPENGHGLQFACNRGAICDTCALELDEESKYWFCRKCTAPVASRQAVWGSGISEPSYFRPPESAAISSRPSPSHWFLSGEEPSHYWTRRCEEKASRRADVLLRRGNSTDTSHIVEASSAFLRAARKFGMSQGTLAGVLKVIHHLHDNDCLVVGAIGTKGICALPRDMRTLTTRADGNVDVDKDINFETTVLSQAELRQNRQVVRVWKTNAVAAIQCLMLDEQFPPGSMYMQRRGDVGNEYQNEDGVPLHASEAYGSERWNQLLGTIEHGVFLLAISIHSDGVTTGDRSHYPWTVSVVNFPHKYRSGEFGSCKIAFAEKPSIRKPRGTKKHEGLDPGQKRFKNSLSSRIAAECLGDLDFAAQQPLTFLYRRIDGVILEERFQIRMHHAAQDIEEWMGCNGTSGKNCNDCLGVQHAMSDGKGAPGTDNRPFMDLSVQGNCATAELRTPLAHLQIQSSLMKLARTDGKTVADKQAKEVRVRYDVENALLNLSSLMPHENGCRGSYGVNGLDILHGLRTGVFDKLVKVLDCVLRKYYDRKSLIKTEEDVRHETDSRLSQMSNWYGHVNFKEGFWGRGDGGGLKGHEVSALVRLLPFAFVGCSDLVEDPRIRKRVLSVTWNLIRLLAEFETDQMYTSKQTEELQVRVTQGIQGMHYLMDILKNEDGSTFGPGHVFDVLKTHILGGAVKFILRFGSLRIIDTEGGERDMGNLKIADGLVGQTPAALLRRLAALSMDHATRSAAPKPPDTGRSRMRVRAPSFSSRRAEFGNTSSWDPISETLQSGTHGPPVPSSITTAVLNSTRSLMRLRDGDSLFFDDQVSCPCADQTVQYYVLKPGHCVQLTNDQYAQILVPLLVIALRPTAAASPMTLLEPRDSSGPQVLVSLFAFVCPLRHSGCHPELPVPWLKHQKLAVLPVTRIRKRVHVVPLFGQHQRPTGQTDTHYLVNTSADPFFAAVEPPVVYLKCKQPLCGGRLPKPSTTGTKVTCAACRVPVVWL